MNQDRLDDSSIDIRRPGEYTCIVSSITTWTCIHFYKPIFSSNHIVKSLDVFPLERNIINSSSNDGWSSLHTGHTLVAINGESVNHLGSSQLKRHIAQSPLPCTLTFCDGIRAQLELSLQRDIKGPQKISLLSGSEIHSQLKQVHECIMKNEMDDAFSILSQLPSGCHFLVPVYKAEIQCLRALVSGDVLSINKALDDGTCGIRILTRFNRLPNLSRKTKMCLRLAQAECLVFLAIGQLLSEAVKPAIESIRQAHYLYSKLDSYLSSESTALHTLVRQDMVGRVRCGLGIFSLFTGVVPSEFHWILQLLRLGSTSFKSGMTQLYKSWNIPNLRSHWAGLALMNATPMLLQHWVSMKKYRCHSGTSTDSSDSDTLDEETLLQSTTLMKIASACLEKYPKWIMYLWCHSIYNQNANAEKALALALEAEKAWGTNATMAYSLQLYIGRLQFKLYRMEEAGNIFQSILTHQTKTNALALHETQQTACIHLAATLCMETETNTRFVRTILNQAIRLHTSRNNIESEISLHIHRAMYYRELPDFHLQLLPFDLLYVCSDNTRHCLPHDMTALTHLDALAQYTSLSSRWLNSITSSHQEFAWPLQVDNVIPEVNALFALDYLTIRGIILLYLNPLLAKCMFSWMISLSDEWAISSFGYSVSCYLLARELVHENQIQLAINLLDHGLLHTKKEDRIFGYVRRIHILRQYVADQF